MVGCCETLRKYLVIIVLKSIKTWYMALRLLQMVNKEVIEILYKQLGNHGKRNSLWSLATDLDKIQVRPGFEGHAVELGVIPKPLKCHKILRPLRLVVRTLGFHPSNRSSNLLGVANCYICVTSMLQFCNNFNLGVYKPAKL